MSAPRAGQLTQDLTLLGRRDAFHVPAILVRADFTVFAGQDVRFKDDSFKEVIASEPSEQRHAIVDPFIGFASAGELFWVFLDTNVVTNLTHTFDVNVDVPQKPNIPDYSINDDDDDGCKGCYD